MNKTDIARSLLKSADLATWERTFLEAFLAGECPSAVEEVLLLKLNARHATAVSLASWLAAIESQDWLRVEHKTEKLMELPAEIWPVAALSARRTA